MAYVYPIPPHYTASPNSDCNYEVLHYRNIGRNEISRLSIGFFATLQDAQRQAQEVLMVAVDDYRAIGWTGYYCNAVDLEMKGLITGVVTGPYSNSIDGKVYDWLSEVHIYAWGEHQLALTGQSVATSNYYASSNVRYNNTQVNNAIPAWPWNSARYSSNRLHPNSAYAPRHECARGAPASFAHNQNHLPYPNQPDAFPPHPHSRYDNTIRFSPHHAVTRVTEEPADAELLQGRRKPNRHGKHKRGCRRSMERDGLMTTGNALGGGIDIGEVYQGRRHSSMGRVERLRGEAADPDHRR